MLDPCPTIIPEIIPELSRRADRPSVSIVASDLSSQGAGRWGGAGQPFLPGQALKRLGDPVEIVGFSAEGDRPSPATDISLQILPAAANRLGPSAIGALFHHLSRQPKGNIVYAYKLKPSSFGLALLHRLRRRGPLVLDIDDWELSWHGGDRYRYCPSPKQRLRDLVQPERALRNPDHPLYLKWLEGWVSQADLVTTYNRFLQQRFGGVIIPNGKDTDLFDPDRYSPAASRAAYGLSPYRVLMFPGAPRSYRRQPAPGLPANPPPVQPGFCTNVLAPGIHLFFIHFFDQLPEMEA